MSVFSDMFQYNTTIGSRPTGYAMVMQWGRCLVSVGNTFLALEELL